MLEAPILGPEGGDAADTQWRIPDPSRRPVGQELALTPIKKILAAARFGFGLYRCHKGLCGAGIAAEF